jgi:hypothetical protein
MNYQGQVPVTHTIVAGEDLNDSVLGTGDLYKVISHATRAHSTASSAAGGILLGLGKIGEHVPLGLMGVMPYIASAAHSAQNALAGENSGYVQLATSGDFICGVALINVASGMQGVGFFNFANLANLPI